MEKLKTIQRLISEYTKITSDIITELDSNDLPRIHTKNIRFIFIKRFHYNSLVIKKLISDYCNDRNFKLPLFIVLRTCLADFLYLKYIDKIIIDNKNNTDEIENEIKSLLVDNLEYLQKELKFMEKNNDINKEKYDDSWSKVINMYPEFFNSDSNMLIESKYKTPKEIKKKLNSDTRFSLESKAYDLYNLYSKFEHLGALTFDLGKNYDNYKEYEEKSIIMSVIWIVNGLGSLISGISDQNKYIVEFKKLSIILDELSK